MCHDLFSIDDDPLDEIGFEMDNYTASEDDSYVEVCVVVFSGAALRDFTANISTQDDSATGKKSLVILFISSCTFHSHINSIDFNICIVSELKEHKYLSICPQKLWTTLHSPKR